MTSRRSKRSRAAHAVTGTVVGVLAFAVPVQHASAHRGTWHLPARHGGKDCERLAHIGDSLTFQAKAGLGQQYARRGWTDVRIDAKGGRGIASFMYDDMTGLDAVRKIKADGFDGCWVMALGTNDTANADNLADTPETQRAWRLGLIRTMMDELDGAPVVWINTHLAAKDIEYSSDDAAAWNAALREVALEYPNMQIFDWDAIAKGHPGWTVDDMVHDTPEGSAKRAEIVARAATMMLRPHDASAADAEPAIRRSWMRSLFDRFRGPWPADAPGP